MYESFFGMEHTPFVRDIPAEKLYESDAFRETLGRLCYVADRQMFAVVTAGFIRNFRGKNISSCIFPIPS